MTGRQTEFNAQGRWYGERNKNVNHRIILCTVNYLYIHQAFDSCCWFTYIHFRYTSVLKIHKLGMGVSFSKVNNSVSLHIYVLPETHQWMWKGLRHWTYPTCDKMFTNIMCFPCRTDGTLTVKHVARLFRVSPLFTLPGLPSGSYVHTLLPLSVFITILRIKGWVDCLSTDSLQALQNQTSGRIDTVYEILFLINETNKAWCEIKFMWVSPHKGIKGNEDR